MLWAVLACALEEESDTGVSWAGWVYAGLETSDDDRLVEGAVTVWAEPFDGPQLAAAQPFEDYPGYWEAIVPPATPVNVRITSELMRPTVWAGDTPSTEGNWFGGSLYGLTDPELEDIFDALGENGDAWVAAVAAGGVVMLGSPAAELDCASIALIDGGGSSSPVRCWSADEEGGVAEVTEGAFSFFAVAVSTPGLLSLTLDGVPVESFASDAGDLVMAHYLWGPQ